MRYLKCFVDCWVHLVCSFLNRNYLSLVVVFLFISSFLLLNSSLYAADDDRGLQRDMQSKDIGLFEKEKKIAIIVSIDKYSEKSEFRPLDYSDDDAEELARVFKDYGYVIKRLENEIALKGDILDEVRKAGYASESSSDEKKGSLVFIFSGHGYELDGKNYLATSDARSGDGNNRLAETGMKVDDLLDELRKTNIRQIMVFIDACRTDPVLSTAKSSLPIGFADYADSEGINVLYSASPKQPSYENVNLKHGVFTYFLLKGLKGEAAQNGVILFDNLASYVTSNVKDWVYDKLTKKQQPERTGTSSGDFLIAKIDRKEEKLTADEIQSILMGKDERARSDLYSYIQEKAKDNDAGALLWMGHIYNTGWVNGDVDWLRAYQFYEKADDAQQGIATNAKDQIENAASNYLQQVITAKSMSSNKAYQSLKLYEYIEKKDNDNGRNAKEWVSRVKQAIKE